MARPMTLDQILEAIRHTPATPERGEGHRVEELLETTMLPRKAIMDAIKIGLRDGRVQLGRRWIRTINGRLTPVPSYVFLDATPLVKGKKR